MHLVSSRDNIDDVVKGVSDSTYFFRYDYVFDFVKDIVSQMKGPVDIASIPCSSGMEPYSLAMTFFDDLSKVNISAFDANERLLRRAIKGTYIIPWEDMIGFRNGLKTVAQINLDEVAKQEEMPYAPTVLKFTMKRELREKVDFGHHNLLKGPLPKQQDIILMLHLLQHYETPDRLTMVNNIHDSLKPGGVLICEPHENKEWYNPTFKCKPKYPEFLDKMSDLGFDKLDTSKLISYPFLDRDNVYVKY